MWETAGGGPDNELVQMSFGQIVNEVLTAAIATVSEQGLWTFTAYVACRGNCFWFTSQESTRHVGEIRKVPTVALNIWRAPESWGEKLVGLQLAGRAFEVRGAEDAEIGLATLHDKFPGTLETLPSVEAVTGEAKRTCMFRVECDAGTIRDEDSLGKGRFAIVWR